jgi:arylsulfatase A-like enzyme
MDTHRIEAPAPLPRCKARFFRAMAKVLILASTGLASVDADLHAQPPPNIVFVIADDLGYGDFSCHGNPVLRTPALDRLYAQSLRLTDYHTGTTCSPTRASLMTGRHHNRLGVWHTVINRSSLRPGIVTLPEVLSRNGYHTALFGKWHLGDQAPMRPSDRGFRTSVMHAGGGVGQTPDHWGNDYFDDVYLRDGRPERFRGYCTDVWFEEAIRYMEARSRRRQPFFCYLSLNAPHQPHRAPKSYIDRWTGDPRVIDSAFYGMISNLDDNMSKLMARMDALGLSENTILIFTSDNGTSQRAGVVVDADGFVTQGFNAGMRGVKGQPWEGGHRAPFFIRYPRAGWRMGRDVSQLSTCMDVLPTLLELCGIREVVPEVEGISLVPQLSSGRMDVGRTWVVDTQRDRFLAKYKQFAVMRSHWRLVGQELFDLSNDPEQRRNVAALFPDTVARLAAYYERWWADVERDNRDYPFLRTPIRTSGTTVLNCMDLFPDDAGLPAWSQDMVRREANSPSGVWHLRVDKPGRYEVILCQRPREAPPSELPSFPEPGSAFVRINADTPLTLSSVTRKEARFLLDLPAGELDFRAGFTDARGQTIAAQYLYFKRKS